MTERIEGEQAYPIYQFSAKWHYPNPEIQHGNWIEGLPEGRAWNFANFQKMYKEEPKEGDLNFFIINWWQKYVVDKGLNNKDCSTPILTVTFVENETWCIEWFQHYTFDTGQTNEEALLSFSKFVDRKQLLIYQKGESAYCLMGAEERWRWRGAAPGGARNDESNPPCRCKHCKEQGVLRIGH